MSLIELSCNQCNHKEMMKEFCPLTGHRYGAGFEYVCPVCRGTMEGPAEDEMPSQEEEVELAEREEAREIALDEGYDPEDEEYHLVDPEGPRPGLG